MRVVEGSALAAALGGDRLSEERGDLGSGHAARFEHAADNVVTTG